MVMCLGASVHECVYVCVPVYFWGWVDMNLCFYCVKHLVLLCLYEKFSVNKVWLIDWLFEYNLTVTLMEKKQGETCRSAAQEVNLFTPAQRNLYLVTLQLAMDSLFRSSGCKCQMQTHNFHQCHQFTSSSFALPDKTDSCSWCAKQRCWDLFRQLPLHQSAAN